jgi:hypothetical protein
LACSIEMMLSFQHLRTFFQLFHSATGVESNPWSRPVWTGDQGNATSISCGVHKIYCNGQWKVRATSSVAVLQHELLSAGSEKKGGVGVWSFFRLTPEAAMRPTLALHTALVSPSSTRHSLPDRPHRTSLSHPTYSLTASVGLIVPAVR